MLDEILPLPPDDVFRVSGFDTYLCNLAVLFGEGRTMDFVGNLYRVHGANYFFSKSREALNLGALRIHKRQHELIFERARHILQGQGNSSPGLGRFNLSCLRADMTIRRLGEKSDKELPGLPTLVLHGVVASVRSSRLSLFGKALSALWFALMAISPRFLAKRLAEASYKPTSAALVRSVR